MSACPLPSLTSKLHPVRRCSRSDRACTDPIPDKALPAGNGVGGKVTSGPALAYGDGNGDDGNDTGAATVTSGRFSIAGVLGVLAISALFSL